jgi:hypothetical protein
MRRCQQLTEITHSRRRFLISRPAAFIFLILGILLTFSTFNMVVEMDPPLRQIQDVTLENLDLSLRQRVIKSNKKLDENPVRLPVMLLESNPGILVCDSTSTVVLQAPLHK